MGNWVRIQKGFILLLVLGGLAAWPPLEAVQAEDQPVSAPKELTDMSLEELMGLEVTSVSRKLQKMADAAAAVFVITQNDIRTSGATTIPDLLRMVPGVQVARIDANKWAVSIRGANGRFSTKLLVLKDGRSIYTPLFSGVFWETVDTPFEDIERIEVIRGPGAAMWGANAVNGVINIITKSAADTLGGLISGGAGSADRAFGTVRYGFKPTENSDLRVYGKHVDRDEGVYANGKDANDAWHLTTGGFRLDRQSNDTDTLTVQGDFHSGRMDETYTLYRLPTPTDPRYSWTQPDTSTARGGNLLARWQHTLSETDNLSLQMYYDTYERNFYILEEKRDTLDLDFQHRFSLGGRQDLLWGLGYRYSHDRVKNSRVIALEDTGDGVNLFSAFLQDEISLLPDTLALILGARLEHNDYTGFELQPNGRLIWTPSPSHTFWGSISRAVRTPARGEEDIRYAFMTLPPGAAGNPLPLRLEIIGNDDFKSETLWAYEAGYRAEVTRWFSVDLALFFNQYDHLRVRQEGAPELEPPDYSNLVIRYPLTNDMHGHTYGGELAVTWRPFEWWRVQAGYQYLRAFMHLDNGSVDEINRGNATGGAPRHQFTLRTEFNLGRRVELDLWLRAVDQVRNVDRFSVPGYVTMDARIAWRPLERLELSLVGQNLFEDQHPEYLPEFINTTESEVPRSIYGKITWNF